MKEVCICQGEHEIHVQVIRSARKTIGLEVRGEDEVWAVSYTHLTLPTN